MLTALLGRQKYSAHACRENWLFLFIKAKSPKEKEMA